MNTFECGTTFKECFGNSCTCRTSIRCMLGRHSSQDPKIVDNFSQDFACFRQCPKGRARKKKIVSLRHLFNGRHSSLCLWT